VVRHGYAGQWHDTETGFIYLRARYYDPTTGQFLTRDPITPITRSPYGYVYGNPLNATDPTGLYCITGVKGHDANGDEICNGASEVAHNTVNATVVTVTHGQADCVMGVTCDPGTQSVVSSATGGAACSRFMDAGCTEPLAEARAQICPTFGCVAVTWDGHNFHHHEALGVAADLSIGLGPVSSCEPHESFWASAFVASLGADHDQGGWSPTGSAGFSPLRFGGGVVHWFN
jgi:RHS repeat-associated protein